MGSWPARVRGRRGRLKCCRKYVDTNFIYGYHQQLCRRQCRFLKTTPPKMRNGAFCLCITGCQRPEDRLLRFVVSTLLWWGSKKQRSDEGKGVNVLWIMANKVQREGRGDCQRPEDRLLHFVVTSEPKLSRRSF